MLMLNTYLTEFESNGKHAGPEIHAFSADHAEYIIEKKAFYKTLGLKVVGRLVERVEIKEGDQIGCSQYFMNSLVGLN